MKILRAGLVLLLAALVVTDGAAISTTAARTASAPPALVDVRASHHAGFDRLVFQFEGGVPSSVRVRYVDELVADPSGLPVRIAGRAILRIRFFSTEWTGASSAPVRRAFPTPNVLTAVRAGRFEGVTTYGIGLARRAVAEVRTVPERSRVVVDLRADFPTVDRRVFFLDVDRFVANTEPFFVPRWRPVLSASPATGVMDRLFAGPTPRERAQGLRLLRSGATSFADLGIRDGIASVRLVGGCSSRGSTVTVAGEVAPTLRQFGSVDWVKIYDPSGRTADPTGPSDSIPECLNP